MQLGLHHYIWRNYSPVSYAHRSGELATVKRVSTDHLLELYELEEDLEARLDALRRDHTVQEIIRRIVEEAPGTQLGFPVLMGDEKPREVAARLGVPVLTVHRARATARRYLEKCTQLWLTWQEA